jgi:hypothetical protein
VHYTTLAGLAQLPQVSAPSLLIAGWCVASEAPTPISSSIPQEISSGVE